MEATIPKAYVGPGRVLTGSRHMVAAGHSAAAHAGFLVLEAGGNAIDAGVAAGIALGVLQSHIVNVAGVAPIMIRMAATQEVFTIDGLGVWPAAASAEFFRLNHEGRIPEGLLRTVTPAAPAAWIAALERFGTMSFGELAAFAVRFAADGFPVHRTMAEFVAGHAADFGRFPENAALFIPDGRPVEVGAMLVQSDLAATLQNLELAEQYLSLTLDAQVQTIYAEKFNYPGSNLNSEALLPTALQERVRSTPQDMSRLVELDHATMATKRAEWTDRWNRVVAAG